MPQQDLGKLSLILWAIKHQGERERERERKRKRKNKKREKEKERETEREKERKRKREREKERERERERGGGRQATTMVATIRNEKKDRTKGSKRSLKGGDTARDNAEVPSL